MYDKTQDDDPELTGSLLLAHPQLKDPNFAASVILLTQHDKEGSLGVVLNRPTGESLGELNNDFADSGLAKVPVYEGGPVNGSQIMLAAWKVVPEEAQFQLFFGMDPSAAQLKMSADPELNFRAFRGYSGWGEGQLMGELDDNAWLVSPVDADSIAHREGFELWRHLITAMNPELGLLALSPENLDRN